MLHLTLDKKKALWGYFFLIVPLVYFFLVFLLPMVQAFYFSVLEYRTLSTSLTFSGLNGSPGS